MIKRFWRWLVGPLRIHHTGVNFSPWVNPHGVAGVAPLRDAVIIAYNDGKIVRLSDGLTGPTFEELRRGG